MMRAEESDTPREEAITLIEAQDGHSDQAVAEDEPATLTLAAEAERRNKEDCINENLLGRLTPTGQGEHSWRTTAAAHPCLAKTCCPGCCTRARAMRHHRSYEGCMYFSMLCCFRRLLGGAHPSPRRSPHPLLLLSCGGAIASLVGSRRALPP